MFQNICDIIIYVLWFSLKKKNYKILCILENENDNSAQQKTADSLSSVIIEISENRIFQKRRVPFPRSSDYLFLIPCLCFSLEYEIIHGSTQAFM